MFDAPHRPGRTASFWTKSAIARGETAEALTVGRPLVYADADQCEPSAYFPISPGMLSGGTGLDSR